MERGRPVRIRTDRLADGTSALYRHRPVSDDAALAFLCRHDQSVPML